MKVGIEYNGMTLESELVRLVCKGDMANELEIHFTNGDCTTIAVFDELDRDKQLALIQQAICERILDTE